MKVARIYLSVITKEQDLTINTSIEHSTQLPWTMFNAGIYCEKRLTRFFVPLHLKPLHQHV